MDWSARADTLLTAHLQTTRQAQHCARGWTGPDWSRLMSEPASPPNRLFSLLLRRTHEKPKHPGRPCDVDSFGAAPIFMTRQT